MEIKFLILALAVVLIFFVILFARRAGAAYGSIRPNRSVTGNFESHRVKTDLTYYLSGSETYPNAIIGVDKRLTLESSLWKQRDFTPEELGELVRRMQARADEHDQVLDGFDILDSEGKYIGEWFSLPGITVMVKMESENRVKISTPPMDTYRDEK